MASLQIERARADQSQASQDLPPRASCMLFQPLSVSLQAHLRRMLSLQSLGKKDFGIPKFQGLQKAAKQAMPMGTKRPQSAAALSALAGTGGDDLEAGPSSAINFAPIDAALTTRDSSSKAFLRELRKVIDRSDVIIQVLDARDPDGTRSRWVEEEVGKRMGDGKKLLGVVNKIGELSHLLDENDELIARSRTESKSRSMAPTSSPLISLYALQILHTGSTTKSFPKSCPSRTGSD